MSLIRNKLRTITETVCCSERYRPTVTRVANYLIVNMYLPCADLRYSTTVKGFCQFCNKL